MRIALILWIICLPIPVLVATDAPPGKQAFFALKHCVMQNDPAVCHSVLTPGSYPLFDKFSSYKLMPCLPTDFTFQRAQSMEDGHTLVVISMPAGGGQYYILRLLFAPTDAGLKLDVPASLKHDLGENWENKIQLSEQIYLLMKQNLGDKLTCDQLADLVKK